MPKKKSIKERQREEAARKKAEKEEKKAAAGKRKPLKINSAGQEKKEVKFHTPKNLEGRRSVSLGELDKKQLQAYSVPRNSDQRIIQAYRGAQKRDVIRNAAIDRIPIRENGENTITFEIQGAVAYARGDVGKQDGAISSFQLDKAKIEEGIKKGILIEKSDGSRDYYAGKEQNSIINVQAPTKEAQDWLRDAIIPGSVKAIDKDVPTLFKPTKSQKKAGVNGTEAARASLSRSSSDISKTPPSEIFARDNVKNLSDLNNSSNSKKQSNKKGRKKTKGPKFRN